MSMKNKEIFTKIDKFLKKNYEKRYALRVLSVGRDLFDDLAEIYFEKIIEGGINQHVKFASFVELRNKMKISGWKSVLQKVDDFISNGVNFISADPLLLCSLELCLNENEVSTTQIQRKFMISYPRAARIVDQMEEVGFIEGESPRKLVITKEEFDKRFRKCKN